MKNCLLLLLLTAFALRGAAQTTAQDFTRLDCDGITHHLFDELDGSQIVFIEYAMLPGCTPCVYAAEHIEALKQSVNAQHPGLVNWYLIEFSGEKLCSEIEDWMTDFNLTSVGFEGEKLEVDYYGGMGMPTLVLLGGADHAVLWKNNTGFIIDDTTAIKNSIDAFLAASAASEPQAGMSFTVSPNPVRQALTIQLPAAQHAVASLEFINSTGYPVMVRDWSADLTKTIDVATLPAGIYWLRLRDADRNALGTRRFVKQ
jgi:thiol-disulfide isomerase/thioredoxin